MPTAEKNPAAVSPYFAINVAALWHFRWPGPVQDPRPGTRAWRRAAFAGPPPIGLRLTPGDGGAQGSERRWHTAPPARTGARPRPALALTRRRARMAMPKVWEVTKRRDMLAPICIAS